MKIFSLLLLMIFWVGCSDVSMVGHPRNAEFFQNLENPAIDSVQAEKTISELKILETGDEYPLRLALFDNQQFYYQVDRLGNGTGTWRFNNGALELKAKRSLFTMEFYLSAAKAEGRDLKLKFMDRHGIRTIETWVRDPQTLKASGLLNRPLKDFTKSEKDI